MSLESATYIADLVDTNPTNNDTKGQGDNHLRMIKRVSQLSFPNIAGEVTPTHTQINYLKGITTGVQAHLDDLSASVTGISQTIDTLSLSYSVVSQRLDTLSASLSVSQQNYGLKLDASATILYGPSGWTATYAQSADVSLGLISKYTVTHNMGLSSYAVSGNLISPTVQTVYFRKVQRFSNYFTFTVTSTTAIPTTMVVIT